MRITKKCPWCHGALLTEEPLKKPPTGKRVIDENKVPFIDAMDHETSEGLLLSETLNTVAENMEEDLVTQELMSIGELNSTATNPSLNVEQIYSLVDNWGNVQEG